VNEFDYSFSENGLVAFHNGVKIGETVRRHALACRILRTAS
jgi:hypothetical protein